MRGAIVYGEEKTATFGILGVQSLGGSFEFRMLRAGFVSPCPRESKTVKSSPSTDPKDWKHDHDVVDCR